METRRAVIERAAEGLCEFIAQIPNRMAAPEDNLVSSARIRQTMKEIMEKAELDAAVSAAKEFFRDMAEWEVWCFGMPGGTDTADERRHRLETIFQKHLSVKALKRKQDRCHSLVATQPPEYAQTITKSEEDGDDGVWVYIPSGWVDTARYLVKNENGSWKIETREVEGASPGKWIKRPNL